MKKGYIFIKKTGVTQPGISRKGIDFLPVTWTEGLPPDEQIFAGTLLLLKDKTVKLVGHYNKSLSVSDEFGPFAWPTDITHYSNTLVLGINLYIRKALSGTGWNLESLFEIIES